MFRRDKSYSEPVSLFSVVLSGIIIFIYCSPLAIISLPLLGLLLLFLVAGEGGLGGAADGGVGAVGGGLGLVEVFGFGALVETAAVDEEAGDEEEAAELEHLAVVGHPAEGGLGGVGEALEEVEGGVGGEFLDVHLLNPDVGDVGEEGVDGLHHGGHEFAFAHVLLPEGLRQGVVEAVGLGDGAYAGYLDAEIDFVGYAFLAHGGGHGAVHREAELLLDLSYLFV
jgi:hypothetical protein